MKIKVGEKLPNSELFYLDQNNDQQKKQNQGHWDS